jgi:hypothetical protein
MRTSWTLTEASEPPAAATTHPGRIFVWAGNYRQAENWCWENGHNPYDGKRIVIVTGDRVDRLRGCRLEPEDAIERVGTYYAHRRYVEVADMFRYMRGLRGDFDTKTTDPGKGNTTMRSTTDHITLTIHGNKDVALGTASGFGITTEGSSKRAPGDRVDMDLGKSLVALRLMRGFVDALEARVGPDADSEHSAHDAARMDDLWKALAEERTTVNKLEALVVHMEQVDMELRFDIYARTMSLVRELEAWHEAVVEAADALSNIPCVMIGHRGSVILNGPQLAAAVTKVQEAIG